MYSEIYNEQDYFIDTMKIGKNTLFNYKEIQRLTYSESRAWEILCIRKHCDKIDLVNNSSRYKFSIFNGDIFPIVPIYISSICQENCLYCNYRSDNLNKSVQRIRLTDDEIRSEIEFLAKKGFRVIELVYATDPDLDINDLSRHIRISKEILNKYEGGMVGLNSRPFAKNEYIKLKNAGIDFIVLWQETYDKKKYLKYHPGNTEKSNFEYRLNAPDRMVKAGINNIGLGILSGLSDWKKDWLALMNHVNYLYEEYKSKNINIILGIPRLKPAEGALIQSTEFIPDDEEFIYAVSIFNLFFPYSLPFVNTRESWQLCKSISKGGGTLFTFNCKTIPGGYSLGKNGYQFPTGNYDIDEYIDKLNGNGTKPILNWNFNNIK